ncbi:MAG: hypothetical protein WAN73_06190, partial [Methyloceanibacter sp.]
EEGLRQFQRTGWLLVDATYEPVNHLKLSGRDAVIDRGYQLLRKDLAALPRLKLQDSTRGAGSTGSPP